MKRRGCLRHHVAQALAGGLVAAIVLSLLEVALLIYVDQAIVKLDTLPAWEPLTALPYAMITYGLFGLLAGLCFGLLMSLVCVIRGRRRILTEQFTWDVVAVLLIATGALLIGANRAARLAWSPLDHLTVAVPRVDARGFVLAAMAGALGLLLLIVWLARRSRLSRVQWSVSVYLALLVVALITSGILGSGLVQPGSVLSQGSITPEVSDKPNILFIVADALRADGLSYYGHTDNQTPQIDALARDGVLYRHTRVQSSWTKPSVATMLTSLYPSSHRAVSGEDMLPSAVTTLPEVLQAHGYRTVGLTANAQVSAMFNFHQGYDDYVFLSADIPLLATAASSRLFSYVLLRIIRDLFVAPPAYHHAEYKQNAEVLGAQALSWLGENKNSRFFIYLHYMDPHDPYMVHPYDGTCVSSRVTPDPPASQATYLRRLYDGEIAFMDAHLGELFAQLKAWGLYEDMLIVFTSDHGEEFHEHGGWWHGFTLYEEMLAVPLIIKYPDGAHAGTVDEELARGLDIAPTVLDASGFPIPEAMQGVSLRPGSDATRTRYNLAELGNEGLVRAISAEGYKLIIASEEYPLDLPSEALFDLNTDAEELHNLAEDRADLVRRLHAKLDEVVASAEAAAVTSQPGVLDEVTQDLLRNLGY